MYPSLLFIIVFVLVLLLVLGWYLLRLQKKIKRYAASLRQTKLQNGIPEAFPGLEDLSSSVRSLVADLHQQWSKLDGERARLAAVLDQMPDGVMIADAAGLIQFANPALKKLFQMVNPEGRTVTEVLRDHQLVEAWRRCQQTTEVQAASVELIARKIYVQLVVIPDSHEGGSLLLVQDLTRVRRLETVRRDFISNISHELRTPLASLKALTETLQTGALTDPEAGPRFLDRIVTEVDALNQMTQELLDLSRIESEQVQLQLAPISPKRLLLSAAERMKLQSQRAGVAMHVEHTDEAVEVMADQTRLEQVLVNLIHNSVKFTHAGGEINLSATTTNGSVQFAVQDTGIGIPSDDLPRVFERFYRVDRSRSGGGTGLGLSIARHLVEAHRGKIWVESVEGKGSTFFFTIPRA